CALSSALLAWVLALSSAIRAVRRSRSAFRASLRNQRIADALNHKSSGGATGGVGSAYKGFVAMWANGEIQEEWARIVDSFQRLKDNASDSEHSSSDTWLDSLKRGKDPRATVTRNEEAKAQAHEANVKTLAGNDEETDKKQKKKEKDLITKWAELGQPLIDNANKAFGPSYGALLKNAPPEGKTPDKLHETFKEAHEAMVQYSLNWGQAYLWSEAQKLSEKHVEDTEKIEEEEGSAVEDQTNKAGEKADELIKTEDQRKEKLAGNEIKTKKKDGKQGGLIAGLVSRMMKYTKYLDDKPDQNELDGAGKMSGDAQDESDEKAKKGKEVSNEGSAKQKEALTDMKTIQGAMNKQVLSLRSGLKSKIGQDKATIEEIKTKKAEHLMKAEEHGSIATSKSESFTADLQELTAWAATFKKERQQFEAQ
ncbi:MAG: hypothetical protein AAFX99_23355, partial [Myxococcota bacterium]